MYKCYSCGSQNTNYSKVQEAKAKREERAAENKKISVENTKALHANLGKTLTLYGLVDYLNRNIQDFNSIKFTVNGKEMTSADIAAIFKKGAVIDLTCDPNALIQSETSYYNKFTKEELLCKIFQCGRLQGAYKNMLRNPKSKIVDVFKRWQSKDIDVGKAYTELFI